MLWIGAAAAAAVVFGVYISKTIDRTTKLWEHSRSFVKTDKSVEWKRCVRRNGVNVHVQYSVCLCSRASASISFHSIWRRKTPNLFLAFVAHISVLFLIVFVASSSSSLVFLHLDDTPNNNSNEHKSAMLWWRKRKVNWPKVQIQLQTTTTTTTIDPKTDEIHREFPTMKLLVSPAFLFFGVCLCVFCLA